jgi:hypothetical protein
MLITVRPKRVWIQLIVLHPHSLNTQALLGEDPRKLRDRLALPGGDLGWMDFVLGRQLRHRVVALDRLKRDLGLELPRKTSALGSSRNRPSRMASASARSLE